jgi:uncharacterized protein
MNRLSSESSPYLLQHAENPVDWLPWGEEAFRRAKAEGKPVFLSVGYSTCHWCHVMARESFSDPATAEILNRHFVSVKVDREERPEVDEIYMTATQLLTGGGGWPNSVFLTPGGKPWFAGTYFPPADRYGQPGFPTLLDKLAELWQTRRGEAEKAAEQIWRELEKTVRSSSPPAAEPPGMETVDRGLKELKRAFDRERGGFGPAPKFPPHYALRLLIAEYRARRDPSLLEPVLVTLRAMASGGIRDHLGGGFHRYSTDARWFAPHFEKMLYDNGQLLGTCAEAFELTGEEDFARAARETAGWALREMRDPGGGFYTALDADSEGEEGKFYTWSRKEILDLLGWEEGELFCRVYGVTPEGNWREEHSPAAERTNILYLPRPPGETARDAGLEPEELESRLAAAREKLLAARDQRVRPSRDEKILADLNGLMISGLARAGRVLGEPGLIDRAREAAVYILDNCWINDRLRHTGRGKTAGGGGYLDDYAFLAAGLLDLYDASGEERWLSSARALADVARELFRDPDTGAFFFTAAGREDRETVSLFRTSDPYDRAVPSGNGEIALVLLRLAELTGEGIYREEARDLLRALSRRIEAAPRAAATLLLAAGRYRRLAE